MVMNLSKYKCNSRPYHNTCIRHMKVHLHIPQIFFNCFNIMSNDINLCFFCFAFSCRALAFTRIDILFFFSASDERVSASSHSCFTKTSSFGFLVFESFRSASISFLLSYVLCFSFLGFIQVDLEPTPCILFIKVGMQSDENAGKPQGILSPECSSGDKECKLLSVFWQGLIQVVLKKYMKAISSNMIINENFTI